MSSNYRRLKNNLPLNFRNLKEYISEGKFVLYNTLIEKFAFFIVFVFLARTITKESYGLITATLAFANILQSFFEFGLPYYFQREAAIGSNNLNNEINSVLKLKILVSPIFLIIIYLYFFHDLKASLISLFIIGTFIYISGLNSLFNSVLLGKKCYKESFQILAKSRSILLLSFFILLLIGSQLEIILVAFIISSLFYLYKLIAALKRHGIYFQKIIIKRIVLNKILKSSIPIGTGIIFVWLYDRSDVLIIQKMINLQAVASYSIAYSLYKMSQIVSGAVLIPSYTNMSHTYEKERFLKNNHLLATGLFLLAISIVLIILYHIFSNIIISILYGIKYISSADYLMTLSYAIPGIFLNNLTGVVSNSIRKEKIPLIGTGMGSLVCIAFNIILIPKIGIWGAVYSTIIVEYLVFLIQLLLLTKHYKNYRFVAVEG